jgi:hypothetical protein
VIARDLAEGRLGFFLARPIPWWSIWGGKWIAALVLTSAAGAIVVLPALTSPDWSLPAGPWWAGIPIPALLALVGGAHAVAVGYRSRSPWFALELAVAAGLGWIVVRTSQDLVAWGVWPYEMAFAAGALWVLAVAVTAGGAAQVARGGSDIRQSHRVLSIVLWSVLIPAVGGYAAWGAWVRMLSPADLRPIASAQSSADGRWIVATGHARPPRPGSVFAAMLVEPTTGRFLRIGDGPFSRPLVSDDGSRAVWIAHAWSEPRLFAADLRSGQAPSAKPLPLPLPPGSVFGFTLSPDGTHIVAVQSQQTTVFAVGSAQPAVVLPTPGVPVAARQAAFSPDGRAHVLVGTDESTRPGVLDVVVLDPATRRSSVTGHLPTRGNPMEHWGPGAERIAIVHRLDHRPSLTLHDGATGALLATLVPEGATGRISATFLHDGRLAVVEAGAGIRLRVFTRDGAEVLSLDVAPRFAMARAVEVAPPVVAVELPFQGARGADSVLVDVDAGRVIRVEEGLRPAASGWLLRDTGGAPAPSTLFIDDRGALVRLDLATGARAVVLGRP